MKTQSKILGLYTFLVVLMFAFTACDTGPKESKEVAEDQNDEKFDTHSKEKDAQLMVDLVAAQYREIRLSKYAQMKSSNADVKGMADMMVTDHTAMLGSLQSLATQKSISVPNEDSTMVNNKIDNWKDDKPMEFDKEWTNEMVSMHKDDVDKMQNAVNDNDCDADIKNLLNSSLPTVRTHLDKLNQMDEMMDKMK
ncbi:MAG: DUF4142 domain-containing protein [Chitinophagales bacterium]